MNEENELKVIAEKFGKTILAVVDRTVEEMEVQMARGFDPNQVREIARDVLVGTTYFTQLQAANIVRLAVYKFNLKHAGIRTYTPDGLREIVARVAGKVSAPPAGIRRTYDTVTSKR